MPPVCYFLFLLYIPFLPVDCNHQQHLKMRDWRKGERKKEKEKNERNLIKVYAFAGVHLNGPVGFILQYKRKIQA